MFDFDWEANEPQEYSWEDVLHQLNQREADDYGWEEEEEAFLDEYEWDEDDFHEFDF